MHSLRSRITTLFVFLTEAKQKENKSQTLERKFSLLSKYCFLQNFHRGSYLGLQKVCVSLHTHGCHMLS